MRDVRWGGTKAFAAGGRDQGVGHPGIMATSEPGSDRRITIDAFSPSMAAAAKERGHQAGKWTGENGFIDGTTLHGQGLTPGEEDARDIETLIICGDEQAHAGAFAPGCCSRHDVMWRDSKEVGQWSIGGQCLGTRGLAACDE